MRAGSFVDRGVRFASLAVLWAAQAAGQRAAVPLGLWWSRPLRYEPCRWSRHTDGGEAFVLVDDGPSPRPMANVRCVDAGPAVLVLRQDSYDADWAGEVPDQALVLRADREVLDGALQRRRDAQIEDARRAQEERVRRAASAFEAVVAAITATLGPRTSATTGSLRALGMSHRWLAADRISWVAVERHGTVVDTLVGYGESVFDECAYELLDRAPEEIACVPLQRLRDLASSQIEADEGADDPAHQCDPLTTWPDLPRAWLDGLEEPPDEGEGAIRVACAVGHRIGQTAGMWGAARVWRLPLSAWCGVVPNGGNMRTAVGTVGGACDQREWTPDCDADVIAEDVAGRLVFAELRAGITLRQKEDLQRLAARRFERIADRFDREFGRRSGLLTAWGIHHGRGVVEMRLAEDNTGVSVWAHGENALGEQWEERCTSEVGLGETEPAFTSGVIERIRAAA